MEFPKKHQGAKSKDGLRDLYEVYTVAALEALICDPGPLGLLEVLRVVCSSTPGAAKFLTSSVRTIQQSLQTIVCRGLLRDPRVLEGQAALC